MYRVRQLTRLLSSGRQSPAVSDMQRCSSRGHIVVVEPSAGAVLESALPPEGNVKTGNYRLVHEHVRAYTPTGDRAGGLVPRYEPCAMLQPPRAHILRLLKPADPGRDLLEDIVRPAPRKTHGYLDCDARAFLQRNLLSPSPPLSGVGSPEPVLPRALPNKSRHVMSLAEELQEADERVAAGGRPWWGDGGRILDLKKPRRPSLSAEHRRILESDEELSRAADQLDHMLEESRELRAKLAEIRDDFQATAIRLAWCEAAAARRDEERQLLFLDDVLGLLRGELTSVHRARWWPFALDPGPRDPHRNYII